MISLNKSNFKSQRIALIQQECTYIRMHKYLDSKYIKITYLKYQELLI